MSIISLLLCQLWNRPVLLVHFLRRCPPRLCPWSTTLRLVHHSSQYPHFLFFPKPSPLRRWHSALSFLPSDSVRLQHRSPSHCSRSNLFLIDCKSSNTELLQDWIFCSLVSVNNLPKSTTHHSPPLTLLETSVPCGRLSWLMLAFVRTLKSHLVSYRIVKILQ